jgi:hypothetical protein
MKDGKGMESKEPNIFSNEAINAVRELLGVLSGIRERIEREGLVIIIKRIKWDKKTNEK